MTGGGVGNDEPLRLADKNLAEFIRHTARAGGKSPFVEEAGLLLVAGSHPNPGPYRNVAMRLTQELPAAEALARADEFFAERSRGYVLWVRDHADAELDELARNRGCAPLEEGGLPQLYQEGCPDPVEPGPGIELRWAEDDQSRRDFLMVNADAWGMPNAPLELARATLFETASLDAPNVAGAIAYIDGKPAGTCMAIVYPHNVVGGYWGATAGWARKRGLHDLTTRAIFNAGFALGARISVCQTSPGAAGNLERMGFRQITSYKRYVVPASKIVPVAV
jgi:hypothetical protein